jgi:hypothetical protein
MVGAWTPTISRSKVEGFRSARSNRQTARGLLTNWTTRRQTAIWSPQRSWHADCTAMCTTVEREPR